MNKIKRGVSLLLCSLLLGSVVTWGSVADVQAGEQIKAETKQTINNMKTEKKVSDDQTSDKAGQNEEKDTGDDAQTDTVKSKETFFVLPVYTKGTTAISTDREEGIGQIMDVGFTDHNFAAAVYDSLFEAGWMGTPGQSVKEVLGSFTGVIEADGYARKIVYIVTAQKVVLDTITITDINETFDTLEEAQAFYDSLKDIPDVEVYRNKKITKEKTKLDTQKPEDELIKSIEGIEWLRKAETIDLENNAISDLSPLSINYLESLGSAEGLTDIDEGKKWFGESLRNTHLNISLNPVRKYPVIAGGRLIIKQTLDQAFKLGADPIILIKPEDNSDENIRNMNLSIPYIERGGERIEILKNEDATMIQSTNIDGVYLDYDKLTDEIFPVCNVSSSGYVRCGLGTDNVLWYYGTAENAETDMSTIGSSSMKFLINHEIRIYVKVKPEPAETKLTLTKTVAGTDEGRFRPVKDAKFKLYKAVRDEEGNFVKGELYQSDEYITDEKGEINFSTEIPNGDYCFAETEAPEGFELNSDPVFFSVGGGEMEITGGEQTVTPTEGESTSAGENSTYIDRYSPDVNIKVTPGTGMVLDQIIVTYFDRKTQKNTGKTFTNETGEAAKNAAEFINKGKGDEKEAGVIDGTVTVQPIYRLKANLTVGNDREKTDFVFKKVSAEDQTVMKGVRFKLTCNHKHDKKCKGLISPESCTHAHNDKTGFVDEQGCTWSSEEVSGADGIVKFSKLVSGEYILSEEATLDGFILPKGTWTVTVDAHKDEVKVEKTEKDDSTVPQFEKKDGILQVENEPTVPFSFIKVDEKTGNELAGAEFILYQGDENDAGKWSIVGGPVVSSEEGIVDFGRLKQGEYFLKETKAPKGYLKPTGYWKVTIAVTDDASKKVTFEARGDVPAISGNHIEGFKVSNRETSLLPKMGGNGTKIFVFSGFMIICCSLVLYFRFKRKGA